MTRPKLTLEKVIKSYRFNSKELLQKCRGKLEGKIEYWSTKTSHEMGNEFKRIMLETGTIIID